VVVRVSNGAALYKGTIDGLKIEVIKVGNKIAVATEESI
jgi:hypothetical protein